MTVAELMKRLNCFPQDAIVTISNNRLWIDGEYEATSVETYDCKTVQICSDYEHRIEEQK